MIPENADDAPLDLDFSLVAENSEPVALTGAELESLARYALAAEGAGGRWEVTVALVHDERLQTLHRDFMKIDSPTDIMTFPLDGAGGRNRGGDLVISVDHARTQAAAWGLSPEDEIRFLVIHGLLHLLGWRDDDEGERKRMLERQQLLLDRWREAT